MPQQITITIPLAAASSYPIHIATGLLTKPQTWLPKQPKFDQIVIITDTTVKKLYGNPLLNNLRALGYQTTLLAFRGGEKSKNQDTKSSLEQTMLTQHCGRNTLCIALGGGVVGDMAGFISATYMRGIAYLQLPTTLLAMVDSSVGGKTGLDTPQGKNLIGAFWQPQAVVADLHCLTTLPKKHIICGLVEAFKMFLTCDAKSFKLAEKNLDALLQLNTRSLENIITRAVRIKAAVVEQDERESNGLRMILNFGHTIGHALEQICNYKILHGYAVGAGILVEAKIAQLLGILSAKNYATVAACMVNLGIDGKDLKKYDVHAIIQATRTDKKAQAGAVRYVLLQGIGQVYIDNNSYAQPVEDEIVRQAFLAIQCTHPN